MKLPTKPLTIAVLIVLGCTLILRDRLERVAASDRETITWGATDPSWSPDGARLAFSLFGSIWQVPSKGGQAQQITTSSGYHAHPAWSPQGDTVAWVRGSSPRGRLPLISGRLVLVDVSTGREREIQTRYPVAGTPAWSPDGTHIVCGLRVPNAGSLLHEITVANGKIRQLQYRPQRSAAGSWISASSNPQRSEIFFAAQRVGPAQIWAMPSDRPPIMVQMPLTRYRPEDIVFLHTLSAVPDGSGVVYSAVAVNGKGDYELYRISRQGGKPVTVTGTERDEFSPAVSPDGRLIAHVSNHLGNIDLFTMPLSGGKKKHVQITGLKFRKPSGWVRVRVTDELGNPTPVRLYVRASDGKAYCPPGSPIYYYPLEPEGGREGFFVASGDDTFPVPAGGLRLVAVKGIEYRIAERRLEVGSGDTTEVAITMERWTNWNQRGWHTGENHFHANYNGSYYQQPRQSLRWLQAEDLNAANMIVANAAGAFIHDKEFFRGAPDLLSTDRYILYWGQEYRNSDPLGHMAFLNIKKQVPPSYTSVIGSDSRYDFPLNTMAALKAREQGGLVSYVHPIGGTRNDAFDTNLGAKEIPVTAALDGVDSIDILPFGEAAYQLWYRLLNSGFKIAAGAGTDTFTNWRGINRIPGGARQYVEVGSVMSWDRWIARYREGRNFVTNGPLLTFHVNGQPLGSEIRFLEGQSYGARLTTHVTSLVPLQLVEFIQNGRVIESKEVDAQARSVWLEKDVRVERSCWFAVRVTGRPSRAVVGLPRAHSSPIYVHMGAKPTLVREDIELMIRWVDRLWAYLEQRDNFGPGDNRERARKMFDQARQHYLTKLAQARD
ncbi:MAG: CehA/McbA family metallohydrolase [Nitrospiraceae bacterium]